MAVSPINLRTYFPTTNAGAELYGGFMSDKWHFCKIFKIIDNVEVTIQEVNDFLDQNDYQTFAMEDLDDTHTYQSDSDKVSVRPNPYQDDEVILIIERDIASLESVDLLVKKLHEFRDARDWEQFHNSKDLALALSIEASELNELFLWKSAESVDVEKLKEELADVFSFALLLAAKHNLNLESIVLEKIAENNEKYPVDKAKGNAAKYDEL